MRIRFLLKAMFIFLLFFTELSFPREPITIDRIPSRIKLFETINFNFKVDLNKVKEYRYRLRVPGDWMGGIKYLSNSWSVWQNNHGRNIALNNFNVEGNYKFEIEYKEHNSRRGKKLLKNSKHIGNILKLG